MEHDEQIGEIGLADVNVCEYSKALENARDSFGVTDDKNRVLFMIKAEQVDQTRHARRFDPFGSFFLRTSRIPDSFSVHPPNILEKKPRSFSGITGS
ncbi:hypothetical protein, partial [Lutimaribacter saemankumensis]|uniref:hypothetical protein n=1 Tax=Lutimaribacter saemankumensis TaxID=490829 RepID=UPI001C31D141